jgi:ATP-dependent helicase/nuclease subunit A
MTEAANTTPPPDQDQRQRIVEELGRTVLVEAAAGTGKTTSMVDRMLALIEQGKCPVERLAAVTFTRKAAAELRARFQVALENRVRQAKAAARDRLADAASRVEQCFIGTIHSFCARLLRERPVEAGVDVAFEELDEDADRRLREQAWEEHVARLYAEDDPLLAELEELGLGIAQLEDAFHARALYPDVERWPAPPVEWPDLATAAGALKDYARHMESLLPSFTSNPKDSGKDRLMWKYGQIVRMVRNGDMGRLADVVRVFEQFKLPYVKQSDWPGGNDQGKAEKQRFQGFKADVAEPFLYAIRALRYPVALRAVEPALAIYDRLRQEAGGLNFQDLLLRAAALLRNSPHVRTYFRQHISHLLVDEFQDTDPIQAEVMLLLTADDSEESDWRRCRPVPGSIFVVGDPKQSIYRFRRADIVTYNEVKRIVEETDGLVLQLTANFRTVPAVLDWVNSAFTGEFPPTPTPESPVYVPLEVGRTEGTEGDLSGVRQLHVPPEHGKTDEAAEFEANLIARAIRRALDEGLTVPRTPRQRRAGVEGQAVPGDFMIVTQRKARLSVYAGALGRLGIPHEVTGGAALNEVAELKLLHRCLAAVVQPENPVALVAALRSDLFGISDPALYAFKAVGGTFRYTTAVPDGLEDGVRELFQDAFERLRAYARWLAVLPPVTAIEKVATDIGLPVLAASSAGGDIQAGSLAKAIELLRSAQRESWTAAELLDLLGQLVAKDEPYDGIPARHRDETGVRVMNLHKVKGLEAPVVFLADAAGRSTHPPRMHIDRSEDTVQGALAVTERVGQFGSRLLAHPADWEARAEAEEAFAEAEDLRLLYVAATRAGAQLIVTRRAKGNRYSPWQFFKPHLEDAPALADPGPQTAPEGESIEVRPRDVQEARVRIRSRWAETTAPTYEVAAAKQLSLAEDTLRPGTGEHGTEWGSLVHRLLQVAMADPEADLAAVARSAVGDEPPIDVDAAVETVRSVMASDLWQRASAAEEVVVEVPFAMALRPDDPAIESTDASASVPTLLRGVIDLAFREANGWVLVDYKSDSAPSAERIDALVEHYLPQVRTYASAWQRCTDQPVKEIGLYFTSASEYRTDAPPP